MTKFTEGPAYQTELDDDQDTGLPAGCTLIAGLIFWAILVLAWALVRVFVIRQ